MLITCLQRGAVVKALFCSGPHHRTKEAAYAQVSSVATDFLPYCILSAGYISLMDTQM